MGRALNIFGIYKEVGIMFSKETYLKSFIQLIQRMEDEDHIRQ